MEAGAFLRLVDVSVICVRDIGIITSMIAQEYKLIVIEDPHLQKTKDLKN
jgi:hypothetical protein